MKVQTFERALHRWQPWLDSISKGKRLFGSPCSWLTAGKMSDIAKTELVALRFPDGVLLELYWLCCVVTDYMTDRGFMFEKLVLPDWFPSPFGRYSIERLRGRRVSPPTIWSEADRKFLFSRDTLVRLAAVALPEKLEELYEDWPDRDFTLVLPDDHPIRRCIKSGQPTGTLKGGETLLE